MKRTYPANINGQIFYIDDDAFNLLQNYLEQLKQTFTGEEGAEIVADIESRIREHFNSLVDCGAKVIVIADVNNVITTMGRPEELGGETESSKSQRWQQQECQAEKTDEEQPKATPEAEATENKPFISFNLPGRKRLYRNLQDKVFGGVFGGLGTYLGWNANIMRILYLVAVCFSYFWPLTLLYLIAWMIIPPAVTPRQRMEMNGTPVNVETVGRAVVETVTPPPYNEKGIEGKFFPTLFNIIGKVIMGIFALFVGSLAFSALVALIAIFAGAIAMLGFNSVNILSGLELSPFTVGWTGVAAAITGCAFLVLTGFSLVWGACSVIFHTKPMSSRSVITVVIFSVMLLVACLVLFSISSTAL